MDFHGSLTKNLTGLEKTRALRAAGSRVRRNSSRQNSCRISSGRAPALAPCAQEVAEWDADEDAEVGEARVNALAHGDDMSPRFQEQRRAGAAGSKASENWRGIKRVEGENAVRGAGGL